MNSNSMKSIQFSINKTVRVTRIFIKEGHYLTTNEPIFTMVDTDNPNLKKEPFLSTVLGKVTRLYIHTGDIVTHGSIILEYEECQHEMTLGSLCCDCGQDLSQLEEQVRPSNIRDTILDPVPDTQTNNRSATTVSMVHAVPGLKTTLAVAEKLCIEERDLLLRQRKLDLLVDLDQTVLHTTNSSNYYPFSPDVVAYQLNARSNQTFYTKFRPGLKEFLTNLLPYYRFHIVTFGERLYAHTMAQLIDPENIFFYHRILSRNECLDPTKKTANLSALFPCGDSMVCIIDDREDVWSYAKNLIHVRPYVWFKDVGDINGIHLPSPPIPSEQLIPPISEKEFEEQLVHSEQEAAARAENESQALVERTTEEGYQLALHRGEKRKHDDAEGNEENLDQDESNKKLKDQQETIELNQETVNVLATNVNSEQQPVKDDDQYLKQLQVLLKRVHEQFYSEYDRWSSDKSRYMPDLKQILPEMRREILKGQWLCFSHLMPQGYPLEKHRATIIARAMGANVTADIQIDDRGRCITTHVVAGKQTAKVERAHRHGIHVVVPEWLIDCYEQWTRKTENDYSLKSSYDVKRSRLFTRETPSTLTNNEQSSSTEPKPSSSTKISRISTNEPIDMSDRIEETERMGTKKFDFNISAGDLSDMEDEMEKFCNEDDETEDSADSNDELSTLPVKLNTKTAFRPVENEDDSGSESSNSQKFRRLALDQSETVNSDDDEQIDTNGSTQEFKNPFQVDDIEL